MVKLYIYMILRAKGNFILIFLISLFLLESISYSQIHGPNEMKVIGRKIEDATFFDHEGKKFNFYSILDSNSVIIISPIYTKCPHTCPLITSSLKKSIEKIYSKGLTNFKVVSISFDDTDTPDDLKKYIQKFDLEDLVEKGVWTICSADQDNLKSFFKSFDFVYIKHENGLFDHPNLIAFLSPDGRLYKFIYGFSYEEEDITNAILGSRNPKISRQKFSRFVFFIGVVGFLAVSIYLIFRTSKRVS